MKHELPKLPYAYDALEPFIDARTMEIHHAKHHQAYIDKLNAALEKHADLKNKPLQELLGNLAAVPDDIKIAVRNHGGGHFNHSLFWKLMRPPKSGAAEPDGELKEAIARSFGGFAKFREAFSAAAAGVFGSGWAWLAKKGGVLAILTEPNQDNPISRGFAPVLGIDVWEHAYYLKYQNRRVDYIEAWWNIVNWEEAKRLFLAGP